MSDYSYDQGEDNYYDSLLSRGKGDGDLYSPPGKPVEHVVEPADGLLSDMLNELDLTEDFKLKKRDCY